jgi:endonuclease/exonuclease/phosphatase family metal-dependent hydrolase
MSVRLRIATYNVLNGGHDGADPRRLERALAVLVRAEADIVLLQEARGFERDGSRLLFDAERQLGMRGQLAGAPHTGQHTAVFTAPTLTLRSFVSDSVHFHHAAAVAEVSLPDSGQELTVASVHLSPTSPHARLAEAGHLAALAAPDRRAIIGGDFNSPGPTDPEPPDWDRLPPHFRVRYLDDQGATSDRRALALLAAAGFTDIGEELGARAEATVPTAGFPASEFVPFRSDHVLVGPALAGRAISHAVLRDDITDHASDHYPVVVELDLP